MLLAFLDLLQFFCGKLWLNQGLSSGLFMISMVEYVKVLSAVEVGLGVHHEEGLAHSLRVTERVTMSLS